MSSDRASARVINAVGYPYLNGVLRDGGFFDPRSERGIWVSGNYRGDDWKTFDAMTLSARGKKHYKATTNFVGNAKQLARMLALAARDELFDGRRRELRPDARDHGQDEHHLRDHHQLQPGCDRLHAGRGRRPPAPAGTPALPDLTIDAVASKIGVGVRPPKAKSDCAVIERTKGAVTLRYVVVVVGGDLPRRPRRLRSRQPLQQAHPAHGRRRPQEALSAMAILTLSGPRELLLQLPRQESVEVSIKASTARENDDGTWTVAVHAPEDQIPGLEGLGYTVQVVTTDAQLLARWQDIAVNRPPDV